MNESKQKNSLINNIRKLGNILGETLKEQVSEEFFNLIEEIRNSSKKAERGQKDAAKNLYKLLNSLSDEQLKLCARAFTHFLNLVNVCESLDNNTEIKEFDNQTNLKGYNLQKCILKLLEQGVEKDKIYDTIKNMKIDLVMTAHPTEIKRRTLIKFYKEVLNLLSETNKKHTINEKHLIQESLANIITIIWQTDEIRRIKPTPLQEAKWGIAVIEDTLWDAVALYSQTLDNICLKYLGRRLPLDTCPISFGSWMGGDRDGNPNVTHKVTLDVVKITQIAICDFYIKTFKNLAYDLAMFNCTDELRARLSSKHSVLEPYRNILFQVIDYINGIRDKVISGKELILDYKKIADDLELCYRSLLDNKAGNIANSILLPVIRQTHCFKNSMLRLDIRQESTRHTQLLDEITESLELGSYAAWDEKKRIDFLIKEHKNLRPLIAPNLSLSVESQEVWDTFKVIAELSHDVLGAYVISQTNEASDILAVSLLQKQAGVKKPLRIAPLLETLKDLKRSGDILSILFKNKDYLSIINHKQEVMVGYSDSGKDAGNLAANWQLYIAQQELTNVADKYGIELTLFHGRGGSISRGGWQIEHALMSQPPNTIQGRIRITEQGEVIQQKYSTIDSAQHNLILYISSVLKATLSPPRVPNKKWIDVMEKITKVSNLEYSKIIRENKEFLKYFHNITPSQALSSLRIGSRPSKRKQQGGLESLRAIPWIFAWTQIRLMMPVWLGTDEAFEKFYKKYKKIFTEMMLEWPFFRSMIQMVAMVIVKTEPKISQYYEELLAQGEEKEFGNMLRKKLTRVDFYINELLAELPQRDFVTDSKIRNIKSRNPYANILNFLQATVIKRLNKKPSETLEEAMAITVAGVSAAMKNTG